MTGITATLLGAPYIKTSQNIVHTNPVLKQLEFARTAWHLNAYVNFLFFFF